MATKKNGTRGKAAKVARLSRTICHGGRGAAIPAILATSAQIVAANSSRGGSSRRSALLMVTESRPSKANSHSTRPLTTPVMTGRPFGGSIL